MAKFIKGLAIVILTGGILTLVYGISLPPAYVGLILGILLGSVISFAMLFALALIVENVQIIGTECKYQASLREKPSPEGNSEAAKQSA